MPEGKGLSSSDKAFASRKRLIILIYDTFASVVWQPLSQNQQQKCLKPNNKRQPVQPILLNIAFEKFESVTKLNLPPPTFLVLLLDAEPSPWACLNPAASAVFPLSPTLPCLSQRMAVYTASGSARGFCLLNGVFSSALSAMAYLVCFAPGSVLKHFLNSKIKLSQKQLFFFFLFEAAG